MSTRSGRCFNDNLSDLFSGKTMSEDAKIIIGVLSEKLDDVSNQFAALLQEKEKRISSLEEEVVLLRGSLSKFEERLEDSEAKERKDILLLSGEAVPHSEAGENCTLTVQSVLKEKLSINILPSDILSANRLGTKSKSQGPDRRTIAVKFKKTELRDDIVASCKSVKPRKIFFNECLTPTRSTILFALRQAKKKFPNKVSGCGSINGRVFVWVKPLTEGASTRNSKTFINTYSRLQEFCLKTLDSPATAVIDRWPH